MLSGRPGNERPRFWSTIPTLLAAAILWDWRFLVLALGLGFMYGALGTFGAVSFWELANVNAFTDGYAGAASALPTSAVKEVRIGRG